MDGDRARQQVVRTGRHRMIRSCDRSQKRTPLCRLGRCLLRQASRPGRQRDLFPIGVSPGKIPALQSSTSGRCAAWAVRDGTYQTNERKCWKRSSAGYPAAMLAAWMALERRSFSLVDPLDFIVTVNRGIGIPDCWIFLHPDIS
jgi:hypothetical protein